MEIRHTKIDEKSSWLPLWDRYLRFYKTELPKYITELTWKRFHDPREPANCIGAFLEGKMIGFVTYLFHRSTWSESNYCYLEDLFVDESVRGKGTARKLIQAVYNAAKKDGCSRVYWTTQDSNQAAKILYDKVASKTDFIQYRIPINHG